jgi:membrane-associated phospholipid phosphatase
MTKTIEKISSKLSGLSRRSWMILLLAAILIIFYNVAEDVKDHETLSAIDPVVGQWVVTHVTPLEKTLAEDVTRFGSLNVMKIGILAFAVFALFKRQWIAAGILAASLLSGEYLNELIKNFFMRTRPDFLGTAGQISGYSFPSNHSMTSVIFYGMIAYLLTQIITNRNARILIWAVTGGLILAIGLSRMILGVHYMTDVLGGWLAGGTWLLVCILVGDTLKNMLEKIGSNVYQRVKVKFY